MYPLLIAITLVFIAIALKFRRRKSKIDFVPYYDFETKKTVSIPKHELGPGVVLVQIEGHPEPVYVDSSQLKPNSFQHPAFEGESKILLQNLARNLADVHPLTYEQWEDGFRRDQNAEWEIAAWIHVSDILKVMTKDCQFSAAQRKECFRVLVACLCGERKTVRDLSDPKLLSKTELEQTITYFYDGGYKSDLLDN